jgi:FkbM family methyltransferase
MRRPRAALARLRRRIDAALARQLRARLRGRVGEWPRLGLEKIGTDYGGWVVPTSLIRDDWIVYDGGVGEDASFARGLIARFGCTVQAFDPTPRAIAYAADQSAAEPRFRFMPVGLWSEDTTLRFWAPRDATHVSHSVVNLQRTSDFFEAAVRSVESLMRELGHERLDLLKLDVEGAEHVVVRSVIQAGIRPAVLAFEIDRPVGPWRLWQTVRLVMGAGYALVAVDGWNFTFVRKDVVGRAPAEAA